MLITNWNIHYHGSRNMRCKLNLLCDTDKGHLVAITCLLLLENVVTIKTNANFFCWSCIMLCEVFLLNFVLLNISEDYFRFYHNFCLIEERDYLLNQIQTIMSRHIICMSPTPNLYLEFNTKNPYQKLTRVTERLNRKKGMTNSQKSLSTAFRLSFRGRHHNELLNDCLLLPLIPSYCL